MLAAVRYTHVSLHIASFLIFFPLLCPLNSTRTKHTLQLQNVLHVSTRMLRYEPTTCVRMFAPVCLRLCVCLSVCAHSCYDGICLQFVHDRFFSMCIPCTVSMCYCFQAYPQYCDRHNMHAIMLVCSEHVPIQPSR
jgi:hypothetical protein